MKQLQVLLVAVAGAAAAIPGMAALGKFEVPGGSEALFEFVLAAFAAAVVLFIYLIRGQIGKLSIRWVALLSIIGVVLVFSLFIVHVSLTNKVLVTHEWGGEPRRQFVPLFLPDSVENEISEAGSRRAYIMSQGPDVFLRSTNESNVAWTLAVLLVSYTALVVCLAAVFGLLAFKALAAEGEGGGTTETAVPG